MYLSTTKNGVLSVTTLFFWQFCFSLRNSYKELIWFTNYPNINHQVINHLYWRLDPTCLRVPYSNATLAKVFSQLNLIKTALWSQSNNGSLETLFYIRICGLTFFTRKMFKSCVNRSYNTNNCRRRQGKCKASENPKSKISKQRHFEFPNILFNFFEFYSSDCDGLRMEIC